MAMKIGAMAAGATIDTGAAGSFGGVGGELPQLGYGTAAGATAVATAFANWDVYDRKQGRKAGAVDQAGGNHIFADGEDQYGLSLRKFLPDLGTGVDLGFHFTQYDSKVPYLRLKGQQGIVAGDLAGLFTLASYDTAKRNATAGSLAAGGVAVTLSSDQHTALNTLGLALLNVAYGESACGAYMATAAATEMYGARAANAVYSDAEDNLALQKK
jgi:hypothetical protein